MKLRVKWYWHALILVAAIAIIGTRARTLLGYIAWRSGTEVVLAHIDKVEPTSGGTVVTYSYGIGAQKYQSQFTSTLDYEEGSFATATYAKSDPSVSTIDTGVMESTFTTALITSILVLVPLILLWAAELANRRKRPSSASEAGEAAPADGDAAAEPEPESARTAP